ncbi:MAG TPA: pilin [Methylotenera sp.]|nr:pilin [Methylotenera sp.]HPH04338.1 pilin [Methylotenera sp.]HPM99892.1 pilin [Methylotenera sp.]
MKQKLLGFSAIEMMVVVAIIAILAMIAIPSSLGRIVTEQVKAAMPLADVAKQPIAAIWKATKLLPKDNKDAGLPEAEKIVSNFAYSVVVEDGAIHMTFGNKAHAKLKDKVISFRPAVIEDAQIVPVEWVCGNAKAPEKMVVKGENKTTVPAEYLPLLCK